MFKENIKIVLLSTLVLVLTACASAPKNPPIPKQPAAVRPSDATHQLKKINPVVIKKKHLPRYVATLKKGDLLSNLQRVAARYHFRLVWQLTPYNYHVMGDTSVYSETFDDLIKQLVENYPVKVKIYTKNKVIVIMPEYDLQMGLSNNG